MLNNPQSKEGKSWFRNQEMFCGSVAYRHALLSRAHIIYLFMQDQTEKSNLQKSITLVKVTNTNSIITGVRFTFHKSLFLS